MPVFRVRRIHSSGGILLLLLSLTIQFGSAGFAREAEEITRDLTRLLGNLDGEPLVAILIPNAQMAGELLPATSIGQILDDSKYKEGRTHLVQDVEDALGGDFAALWYSMRPNMRGPALLAFSYSPPAQANAPPALKLSLLLAADNEKECNALKHSWAAQTLQRGKLLSFIHMIPVDMTVPTPKPMQEWALAATDALVLNSGQGDQIPVARVQVWTKNWLAARKHWVAALNGADPGTLPIWIRMANALEHWGLARFEWNIFVRDGQWCELSQVDLEPQTQSTLSRLLMSLRDEPKPWNSLKAALPGHEDVSFLFQLDLPALGADTLLLCMQGLEQEVRGKRWTRDAGNSPEVKGPTRFDFITKLFGGTFGVVGSPSASGESRMIIAAAGPVKPVAETQEILVDKMKDLGGLFSPVPEASKIGGNAPLASELKGRGIFPAPMIGLSPGWTWLCSNTLGYEDLTQGFAKGNTMSTETYEVDEKIADWRKNAGITAASAIRLRVNLARAFLLMYQVWMLSEDGPKLGETKISGDLLPAPALFKKRLTILHNEVFRKDRSICSWSFGSLPGGSLLAVGWALQAAEALDAMQRKAPQPAPAAVGAP